MNKTELIAAVAEKSGLPKKDTERVVNALIDTVTAVMVGHEKVQLTGFGTFSAKYRKARPGINPHTQQPTQIPAAWIPVFTASRALKGRVDR